MSNQDKNQRNILESKAELAESKPRNEWGTFKDSLRAPVHNWFTYPAGFSYKAVEHFLNLHKVKPGKDVIYDPFMGSGTTNIAARQLGVDSLGNEAHPFVYEITLSKMAWAINDKSVRKFIEALSSTVVIPSETIALRSNSNRFPELLHKCFLPQTLYALGEIRDQVKQSRLGKDEKRFLRTALICSLRDISIAATGWPYIAPKKIKITSMSKQPVETFQKRALRMLDEIISVRNLDTKSSAHDIRLGDSRSTTFDSESAKYLFTSPPYLNNFDYSDRTRLEMYFMGEAITWGDISEQVRTKLMTSATTQISRNNPRYVLNSEIQKTAPKVFDFLSTSIDSLSELRLTKGGKKSYDLMVGGYFNDIYDILRDNRRILKTGGRASYILGDSAPYGVHIPTDELIGKLGLAVGFSDYKIEILRERGGKWASNPQRHSVPLRESIVHFLT